MIFDYSLEKNAWLTETRHISFEAIISAIESGGLLDEWPHPNREAYPHQRMFYVRVQEYIYRVPYVTTGDIIFLKTIYPSRVATKKYLSH